jgi:hypothetical protein
MRAHDNYLRILHALPEAVRVLENGAMRMERFQR